MNRLVALLRPLPKPPNIASLDAGTPALRGVRAHLRHAGKTIAIFARPRWIAFHLVVWILAVVMVQLGRWQLRVSDSKHFDLQNFGYSLQWWAFAAFGLFVWVRVMQNHLRPPSPPNSGAGLVLANSGSLSRIGPVDLVAPGREPGQEPIVYRGYVMPKSSDWPVRSHGDTYHDVYNDYLWQLALADGAVPSGPRPARQPDDRPAADADDLAGRAIEPPQHSDPRT